MATGDVTISTFLELRDNLSGGIKSVESQINRLTQAAQQAEDAIKRMKTAQAAKPPKPPPPPAPPGGARRPGAPGGPGDDPFFKFQGGIFSSVVRANLLVDAIESAVVGATSAVAGLLKYTVKVSEEYENAQLNITNTLTSMALSPSIEIGQRKALGLMTQMRELAAKLPGEAKDYINAFSLTLPEALASGEKDVQRYAKFVSMYTATALSKGVDAPQAARDLVEMLQGRAHLRTATFQKLRTQIGMVAKDFNKLDPEQRYTRISAAVDKAGSGLAMAADTASAKFGELKSRIDEIFVIGGQPFFEQVKGVVSDINKWLEKNKYAILDTARIVSTVLGNAFRGTLFYAEALLEKIGGVSNSIVNTIGYLSKIPGAIGEPFRVALAAGAMIYQKGAELAAKQKEEKREEERRQIGAGIAKYGYLEKQLPEKLAAPSALMAPEERKKYETALKELWSPKKGGPTAFETSEEWATFAKSRGFTPEDVERMWDEMVKSGEVKLAKAPGTTRDINVNFNNNRFDIRQAFAEGFDPDRIAVAFASDLGRLAEFQVQSSLAPYGANH